MTKIQIRATATASKTEAAALILTHRRWRLFDGAVEIPLDPPTPIWNDLDAEVDADGESLTLRAGGHRWEILVRKGPGSGPVVRARNLGSAPGAVQSRGVVNVRPVRTTPPAPVVEAPPAPAPKADLTFTGRAETVSEIAVERIRGDEAALAALGLALPPPVRILGGRINALGVENWTKSHAAWAESPRVVDALEDVAGAVARENRLDIMSEGRVRAWDDGRIDFGDGPRKVEPRVLGGLATLFSDVLPGAGRLLGALDPETREIVINRQISKSNRTDPIKVRTRSGAAFALVGPRYGRFDADEVARVVGEALREVPGGSEARGEVVYDPENTDLTISALFHADHVVDAAAGDVFKAGIRVESNDTGGGSLAVYLDAYRNRCFNLIIIGKASAPLIRVRHVGSMVDAPARVAAAIREGLAGLAPFLARWGYLRTLDLRTIASAGPEVQGADLVLAALREIRENRRTRGIDFGISDRDLAAEVSAGWAVEGGETAADLINALTRTHESPTLDALAKIRLEKAAGELVAALAA